MNVMRRAHEIRREAAARFGGRPGDYLLSIALEMAWEETRMEEGSLKSRVEQAILGGPDGWTYRDNDEGGFDLYFSEVGYARIAIRGDRVEVYGKGFHSYYRKPVAVAKHLLAAFLPKKENRSGYSRDLEESDGGFQDYRK